jgi:hypothetical protein
MFNLIFNPAKHTEIMFEHEIIQIRQLTYFELISKSYQSILETIQISVVSYPCNEDDFYLIYPIPIYKKLYDLIIDFSMFDTSITEDEFHNFLLKNKNYLKKIFKNIEPAFLYKHKFSEFTIANMKAFTFFNKIISDENNKNNSNNKSGVLSKQGSGSI